MFLRIQITISLLVVANAQWAFILSNWSSIQNLEAMSYETVDNRQDSYLQSIGSSVNACTSSGCEMRSDRGVGISESTSGLANYVPTKIVLPSINKEAPVFLASSDVDSNLNSGVVLFDSTGSVNGEKSPRIIFGHSSSITKGPYQYVFTRITRLKNGDVVSLEYGDKVQVYRFVGARVMDPKDIQHLSGNDKTLYLATCWPFLTTLKRYVVELVLETETPMSNVTSKAAVSGHAAG